MYSFCLAVFFDNDSSNSVIEHLSLERRYYARGGHNFQEVIAFDKEHVHNAV